MDSFLKQLFGLSRPQKRIIQVLVDVILVVGSFVIAMTLRLDSLGFMSDPGVWVAMALVLSISLPIFVKLGFYRAVVRYITSRAVWTISIGVFALIAGYARACLRTWLRRSIFHESDVVLGSTRISIGLV